MQTDPTNFLCGDENGYMAGKGKNYNVKFKAKKTRCPVITKMIFPLID